MWDHSECCGVLSDWKPECEDGQLGGRPGEWRLTMYESMARYQYVYGLKPIGPHRQLADQLLSPLRTHCPRCDARGLLSFGDRDVCGICPVCEGTGGFWSEPDSVVDGLRATVLESFPEAAAPPVCFLGPVAFSNREGIMLDLSALKRRVQDESASAPEATAVPYEAEVPFERPAKCPRSATLLASGMWTWGPGNSRSDDYYLSTNRSRSHWILWVDWPDSMLEVGERFPADLRAYCLRSGIDRETAATLSLRTFWESEREELGGPPSFAGGGLLSGDTLREIARDVWPPDRPTLD